MRWSGLFILCINFILNFAAKREPDGKIYEHISLGIRPWYNPNELKSLEYPSPAPHDLEQTWRYVAAAPDSNPKAIKLVCSDISIPKNGNKCGDSVLKLEDGSVRKEWCGEVQPFTIITTTTDISLKFTTGRNGGGRIFCTAQAIYLDENRNELTTTTTPPPPPRDEYRYLPSEEVDSSEHGGQAGNKRTSCPCGWANKAFSRIVNGTETNRNEFPFAAALVRHGSRSPFCGATIISEYHAITASHCTSSAVKNKTPLAIIVGLHNLDDEMKPPVEMINVETIIQHQEYTGPPKYKNDLTLLVLKNKITFGPLVGPACLPTHNIMLARKYIKVIGWGDIAYQGDGSDFLRKIDVRVLRPEECNYEYSDVDHINPTQICTFAKRGETCQGDSGGPVIWVDPETNRYTLVGAVSFGSACGVKPTVHTAIGYYIDWIQYYVKATKGSQVCKKIN